MKKDAITLTTLAARLEKAIHCDVGLPGLNILLYGWAQKTKRPHLNATLQIREKRDGERWLSPYEVQSLSEYSGYNLSVD